MESLLDRHQELCFTHCLPELTGLVAQTREMLDTISGNGAKFREAFARLPDLSPSVVDLSADAVRIGARDDISPEDRDILREILLTILPWRKGPFNLFGISLDSEWRSDMKWNRVRPHLDDLSGRRILDIGCSNGYYLFRMMPEKPRMAMGIDPYLNFYYQFLTLQKYAAVPDLFYLPIGLEDMPAFTAYFNTVFLMGILYHQRSPVDALKRISGLIHPGGQLVLETLIIPGEEHTALFPRTRYAKMRNVYFLPTVPTLIHFMERAGYVNVRCVDVCRTTPEEQRKTSWIISESLSDFLDPEDPTQTVEGYPAPRRATVIGEIRK